MQEINSNNVVVSAILVACLPLFFLTGRGAGYIFDDAVSVVPLQQLRDNPEFFWEFVFNDVSGPLGRPISVMTFAIEQAFFRADATFSQTVSTFIHCINTLLVFLILRSLSGLLSLRSIALPAIASILWACSPQKVSTVLYISQRMTLLAASFSLASIWMYLVARTTVSLPLRAAAASCCILCLALAPFAKENGLLALPLIASIEWFIVSRADRFQFDRKLTAPFAGAVLLSGAFVFLILGIYEFSRSDVTYASRSFSFSDRLVSSPAILLDYAVQFFVPDTSRMGIIHDDHSILSLKKQRALVCVFILVAICLFAYLVRSGFKRTPALVAGGLAFFLIAHSLESFYFPLEIYFEHRNYLPSVGLIFAFSGIIQAMDARFSGIWRLTSWRVAGVYCALVILASVSYLRWWTSADSLLHHDLLGHPESARANTEKALFLARRGRYDEAIGTLDRAYRYSRRYPAAKAMGSFDPALMTVIFRCLSGHKDLHTGVGDVVPSPEPSRTHASRLLRELYSDGVCSGSDWAGFSDWLLSVAKNHVGKGSPFPYQRLIDFAMLEAEMRNPLKAYIYASMAEELVPRDGTSLLLMADASIQLNDRESFQHALNHLKALEKSGGLSALNAGLLRKLTAAR